ncbi:MAG: dioxygenase ferredoxin subunit [Parcubacteria group bacterium Gr01-1014_31]|nr:MAG: dioxygenase ferredoxin subunit [Parcubacteria group bacterium Gr01-1014_31]
MSTLLQFQAGELPSGQCRAYATGGMTVMVYHLADTFYATQGLCSHEDMPLEGGEIKENVIQCPFHDSRFNIRTGKVLSGPAERGLKIFPVTVDGGTVTVTLP